MVFATLGRDVHVVQRECRQWRTRVRGRLLSGGRWWNGLLLEYKSTLPNIRLYTVSIAVLRPEY